MELLVFGFLELFLSSPPPTDTTLLMALNTNLDLLVLPWGSIINKLSLFAPIDNELGMLFTPRMSSNLSLKKEGLLVAFKREGDYS